VHQIMLTGEYVIRDYSPLPTYVGDLGGSPESILGLAWKRSCPVRTPALWLVGESVCDPCSAHMTNVSDASISLAFIGE
jgi:hypothetical protein